MSKESNTNKSLARAISLLRSFSPDELDLGVAALSSKTGIPRTTIHRILITLVNDGILKQNPISRKYSIGPVLYALGNLYSLESRMLQYAEEVVKTLNDMTKEGITMAVLNRDHVVIVGAQEAKYDLTLKRSRVGAIHLAHSCALGKALLAEMTNGGIDDLYPDETLVKITYKTIATKKELKQQLDKIRQTSVAFDSEGVYEETEGIASVIRNRNGNAVASIGIAIPTYRMDPAKRELFAGLVKLGARLISYYLGYNVPINTIHDIKNLYSWWRDNKFDLASKVAKDVGRHGNSMQNSKI